MFSLYFDLLLFFGFEGRTLVLIASVPGHCFIFYFFSSHFRLILTKVLFSFPNILSYIEMH